VTSNNTTATTVEQLPLERSNRRNEPGGIWAELGDKLDGQGVDTGDVWRGIERRLLLLGYGGATGLWDALAERTDATLYRPAAVPDVAEEQVVEGDQIFTVIRSPRGNYLRLTETQRDLWAQMDGSRTVSQLAAQAFFKHKQLLPVGDLVESLKTEGFLMDRPIGLYSAIEGRLSAQTAEGWGRQFLRTLASRTWQLNNIDSWFGAIYRYGGRLLFTPLFVALWCAVVLAGFVAFGTAIFSDQADYQLLSLNGSITTGLVALWGAVLVSLIMHESAHALAVKHYRRTIHGGGIMLYYGLLAAFVDTSDIWRSPRRARIIVSAAGPMSDLFVGSIAALAAVLLPQALPGDALAAAGAALAFKVAFTSFASTVFNLNPLLELDGYFILVDLLRLPDLRRRSLAFVRNQLWDKLRQKAPFSREERIFSFYGALTAIYTTLAIIGAITFWNDQLVAPILGLLSGTLPQQILGGVLLLVVVLPVLGALLLAAWEVARAAISWAVRRGYGRRPALLATLGALVSLALTVATAATEGGPYGWVGLVLSAGLWVLALGALLSLQPDYRGAAIAPAMAGLVITTGLAAVSGVVRFLIPGIAPLWISLDGLAFVFVLLAGFAALLDADLRQSSPRELLSTALLLMASFAVGALAMFSAQSARPDAGVLFLLVSAAPAYFGALALAMLLQHLFGLHDSRLRWSWLLLWFAVLVDTAGYIADLQRPSLVLDVLSAGLWATAWLTHLATLRQITPDEVRWPYTASISEGQRLMRAFQFSYTGCYRLLRAVYGTRRAQLFDDRMDVLAATANWDVTLDRDRARIGMGVLAMPIDAQGARYAEVLRYTVSEIEQIAGAAFARRTIQAAYDALPWPERETANRLCFPDTPWARALSSAFGDERTSRLRLLRQLDLLLGCDDTQLTTLAQQIEQQRVPAGTTLLRAGSPAPGIWVIETGEISAGRAGQIDNELHRGEVFGAAEILGDSLAEFDYQATVQTNLLFIPAELFRTINAAPPPSSEQHVIDTAETLRLLERVPLFANMSRDVLRKLTSIAQVRRLAPRTPIVRQGQPSGYFYIIRDGRAAVLVRDPAEGEEPGKVRNVAQLGPKEFFGEQELMRGKPPVASVVSVTEMELLAFSHEAISALVIGNGDVQRRMEQIVTGRLHALRETAAAS
jgi:putative peptide zinc metalloprotease protein